MKILNAEEIIRYHCRFDAAETKELRAIGFLPPVVHAWTKGDPVPHPMTAPSTLRFPVDEAELWWTLEELEVMEESVPNLSPQFRAHLRKMISVLRSTPLYVSPPERGY